MSSRVIRTLRNAVLSTSVILCAASCVRAAEPAPGAPAAATPVGPVVVSAVAVVRPLGTGKVMGVVHFTPDGANKVKVVADITGLEPDSQHAFHIHEFGDCTDPAGKSAGGHYNPDKHEHGKPTDPADKRHPGDMGNLTADATGKAHLEVTMDGISVNGVTAPILGRSIIIHAKADDFSQPVGNAGDRIACGVIGIARPEPTAAK